MDDFFLRPQQRTKERLAEAGGNIDRERFLQEVAVLLGEYRKAEDVVSEKKWDHDTLLTYRRYDCSRRYRLKEAPSLLWRGLTVVTRVLEISMTSAYLWMWKMSVRGSGLKKEMGQTCCPVFLKSGFLKRTHILSGSVLGRTAIILYYPNFTNFSDDSRSRQIPWRWML